MYLKKLMERRAELEAQMSTLLQTGEAEERALSEEEQNAFDAAEAEIRTIDATIERYQRNRNAPQPQEGGNDDVAAQEERAFVDYIMGRAQEIRTGEQDFTVGNNGAIIPTTIANRIIKAVKDRCPILAGATLFRDKGTLKIPVYGNANSTHNITVGYGTEFSDLTADAGAFSSVDLGGYLVGALTLVSRKLQNNAAFDVVEFVVNEMAERIAIFVEGELLAGTGHTNNHCAGALLTTNTMNAGSTSAISCDNLIDLQAKVKQAYQANACWTMNPATWSVIKKLKDGNGRYLVQDDFTGDFPYRLLGKPVYLSDNMPTIASAAKAVLYGDYSGLAVKISEELNIQVLKEKYATMHAIGVVGWMEIDSIVADNQKLAALVMSAG